MATHTPRPRDVNLDIDKQIEDIQTHSFSNFSFSESQDIFNANVLPRLLLRELIHETTDLLIGNSAGML
jgi:hypothetical protein